MQGGSHASIGSAQGGGTYAGGGDAAGGSPADGGGGPQQPGGADLAGRSSTPGLQQTGTTAVVPAMAARAPTARTMECLAKQLPELRQQAPAGSALDVRAHAALDPRPTDSAATAACSKRGGGINCRGQGDR